MKASETRTAARQRHNPLDRFFASDNYAGVHPEVLAAIEMANGGHQIAYGRDDYTRCLQDLIRQHFGERAEAYPVYSGTGANVVSLQAVTDRWGAVICADTAHINADECGAPERVGGIKLVSMPTPDGKLTPELIDREAWGWHDMHRATPQAVSITQATELGTIYTADEIRAIADYVHARGMVLHVDGAQLANAAASLGVSLRELTADAGVDVLSFGGSKSGGLFGEAVVVINPDIARSMRHIVKQTTQLVSKMRFVSVQMEALLADGLWLRNARHANSMAQRLARGVESIEGVDIVYPVQANGVFARLPREAAERLQERYHFYFRDEQPGVVRWMCSFDTTPEDVDGFVSAIEHEVGKGSA
ncbi:threonine aldolase family protein [Streptomyces sp. NPDC004126]|uniref:threonine aldolase family protein n=1 Tax=Streptomyces sp. NPDC004126 TaxID=3390695 RepID=UPI003D07E7C2